ncbi:lectin-like [Scyliorhinus canicula]|uniref:lectin-like n=1 Tax=Scyliorhinus canicula TaxID=7830 RepID=UPI0018F2B2E2|nr:lectin-like [Scyliorhinus canicula]
MVQPIGFHFSGSTGLQSALYIHSHTWNLITSDNWERERFEERNFMPDMMLIGVLLLAAFFSSEVTASSPPGIELPNRHIDNGGHLGRGFCRDGVPYFGHCYKFFPDTKTWIEAELYCQTLGPGSHLASIHWEEQNNFIFELIFEAKGSHVPTWIGFNDLYKEGTFLWTDGSSSHFKKWRTGEPNNQNGTENCGNLWTANTKSWNDVPCDRKYSFICSYKLPCY